MRLLKSFSMTAAVLFFSIACGGAASSASTPPSAHPSSEMMHHGLDVKSSRFGQVLVDSQGRALYLFASDTSSVSTCYGACATAWPPFLGEKGAAVEAMSGVSASLVGTTTRTDGTVQVTYNGHPLYYYVGDKNPGEINCQGAVNFGGAWYVVDPQGKAITKT